MVRLHHMPLTPRSQGEIAVQSPRRCVTLKRALNNAIGIVHSMFSKPACKNGDDNRRRFSSVSEASADKRYQTSYQPSSAERETPHRLSKFWQLMCSCMRDKHHSITDKHQIRATEDKLVIFGRLIMLSTLRSLLHAFSTQCRFPASSLPHIRRHPQIASLLRAPPPTIGGVVMV